MAKKRFDFQKAIFFTMLTYTVGVIVLIIILVSQCSCSPSREMKSPDLVDAKISVLQLDSIHRTGGYVEYYLSHPLIEEYYFKFKTRGPRVKYQVPDQVRITPEIRYSKYYPLMMVKKGGRL